MLLFLMKTICSPALQVNPPSWLLPPFWVPFIFLLCVVIQLFDLLHVWDVMDFFIIR